MNAGKINLLDKASGKIVTLGLAGGVTVDYVVNMPMSAGTLVTEEQLALGGLLVIDNLLSSDQVKALSANQGRLLKSYIDAINTRINGVTTTDIAIDKILGLQAALNAINTRIDGITTAPPAPTAPTYTWFDTGVRVSVAYSDTNGNLMGTVGGANNINIPITTTVDCSVTYAFNSPSGSGGEHFNATINGLSLSNGSNNMLIAAGTSNLNIVFTPIVAHYSGQDSYPPQASVRISGLIA